MEINEIIVEQVIRDQILTNLAVFVTLSGVLISAFAFWKTFTKLKKSEQYKLIHDILVMYSNAQINHTKAIESTSLDKTGYTAEQLQTLREVAFMEIMNVLEWASFLILRKSIDKELIEFLELPIITNYDVCVHSYPSLLHDENEYKEIKALHGRWMKEKHEKEVRTRIHEQI